MTAPQGQLGEHIRRLSVVEKCTDFSSAGKVPPRLQLDPQDTHRFPSGHHPVSRLCWGTRSDPHQQTLLERRGSLSWIWTYLEPSLVFRRHQRNVSPFSSPPFGKRGFPGGSDGKESTCNAGDLVRSLGQEDPLEEGMEPTPVFLPGESHGQRSLVGYGPLGCTEFDTTERLTHTHTHTHIFGKKADFSQETGSFYKGAQQTKTQSSSPFAQDVSA